MKKREEILITASTWFWGIFGIIMIGLFWIGLVLLVGSVTIGFFNSFFR